MYSCNLNTWEVELEGLERWLRGYRWRVHYHHPHETSHSCLSSSSRGSRALLGPLRIYTIYTMYHSWKICIFNKNTLIWEVSLEVEGNLQSWDRISVQKVKGCWVLGPKWGIHVTPLLLRFGDLQRRGGRTVVRGGGGIKESVLQTLQGMCELTAIVTACARLTLALPDKTSALRGNRWHLIAAGRGRVSFL